MLTKWISNSSYLLETNTDISDGKPPSDVLAAITALCFSLSTFPSLENPSVVVKELHREAIAVGNFCCDGKSWQAIAHCPEENRQKNLVDAGDLAGGGLENSEEGDESKVAKLTPAVKKAWLSWELAEKNNPGNLTDRKAYDWIAEQDLDYPLVGYKLPAFDTWAKYVRIARKHTANRSTNPGAGLRC